ncbi:MAG: 4Fe-4S dicluster domain-containing protein [Betaproteobacteria bacterium]|nr:4Fe-4S dicluster domain-containing protein [Betaproteobacteria bacterium]
MTPSREILFNIDVSEAMALYLLMTIPIGLVAYGLARRVSRWKSGRPENRVDQIGHRIWNLLRVSVFHGRIVRRRNTYGGFMHLAIFSGFVTLLIGTSIVMIEADIAVPVFGVSFFHGNFYLGFKLAMNAAGLLLIAGVVMAFYRRLVLRPATQQSSGDDLLLLVFLLVLAIQGFALQCLRLAITRDPWAAWSFVSYPVALALQDVPVETLTGLHQLNWHAHFVTAFLFLGYVAYSKMIHPFTALANVLFRRLRPPGELDPIADLEQADTVGASRLEHFSWAQLMSVDACMHCGRCLEYCPTFSTGKALRPRDLVLELAGLQADRGGLFSGVLGEEANSGRYRWGRGAERELIGGAVSTEEIWDCTTCAACMEQCPVYIEHVPLIVGMRRNLVMEQNSFPPELAPVFTSLERLGNPYQNVPAERAAWTRKLEQPVAQMSEVAASGKSVEYLFFVGCIGSFVPRNQKVTIALIRVLQAAGISFAILGKEETCNGDPARRMGHEYLARQLAAKTVAKLNFYNVKKVVTACPHCFNAIRNEYPQLGGNYEVVHHSQLIAELIASGRLTLDAASSLAQGKVTYHDPCYLGRYNSVYDEPRNVLGALPATDLTEMPRSRNHSFCCGGGGGRAMMKEQRGIRINQERVREALNTGAQMVAAGCPFCMSMLEDGIVGVDAASKLRVHDLAELVAGSLQTPPPRS